MSKINNPKVEVPTGIEMNDKDITNSLLSTIKTLEKNYVVAMIEASNDLLANEYKEVFDRLHDLQRETFELAFKNGWYELEEADGAKVGEKYNMLSQSFDELEEEPEDYDEDEDDEDEDDEDEDDEDEEDDDEDEDDEEDEEDEEDEDEIDEDEKK